MEKQRTLGVPRAQSGGEHSPPRIIAAVDAESADFLSVMLSRLGYKVETISDGEAALEKIRKSPPSIAILDTALPKKSGWEVLARIKEDSNLALVPVILLSEAAGVKDEVEAFEQGAAEYIVKPFNFSALLARIRAILRTRELLNQLAARESRLSLAEGFYLSLTDSINQFLQNLDSMDEAVSLAKKEVIDKTAIPAIAGVAHEKIVEIRAAALSIKERVDLTAREWAELKKNEIALAALKKSQETKPFSAK